MTPQYAAADVDTDTYAEACRAVGLAFLEGAHRGWGKRELAAWLVGPYQSVSMRVSSSGEPAPDSERVMTPVTESAVLELVDLVRIAVASVIGELKDGDTSAVSQLIRDQMITSRKDENGGLKWFAIDRPRVRLEARVLSLFAVDYLMRTEHYERGDVMVCSDCDTVAFEGDRPCAVCGDRPRSSHVRGTANHPGILGPIAMPVKIVG